jgi:hypothetical protein
MAEVVNVATGKHSADTLTLPSMAANVTEPPPAMAAGMAVQVHIPTASQTLSHQSLASGSGHVSMSTDGANRQVPAPPCISTPSPYSYFHTNTSHIPCSDRPYRRCP